MPRLRLLAWLALLLPVVACDDPASDLGSDLLGNGQEPEVRPVTPTLFYSTPFADITGHELAGQELRVLAGTVDDPLLGSVVVTGHIDFNGGFSGTGPTVTGAALRLRRSYAYGDTTSMLTVALHDILEDWTAIRSKADTMLVLGPEITTHTFFSTDTVVVIPMPMTWVDTYADTLRHARVDSLFHGLALAPLDGQSILGFTSTGTSLQVHTASDTTDFAFQKSLTTTSRLAEPTLPENRVAIQDGAGPGVRVEFDLAEFDSQPINGAVFLVYADTLAMQEAPMNFVRPIIQELQMVAVRDEGALAILVGEATMSEEGIFAFSGSEMAAFFYRVLFGLEEYEYLELRVPVLENSVNGLLLHSAASKEYAPELRLILGS